VNPSWRLSVDESQPEHEEAGSGKYVTTRPAGEVKARAQADAEPSAVGVDLEPAADIEPRGKEVFAILPQSIET
jgi:hypothetical protein